MVGFKFAARTLLELGKELISSDEVALYELIKNGIDAQASRITIDAEIVLTHTSYVAAMDALGPLDALSVCASGPQNERVRRPSFF